MNKTYYIIIILIVLLLLNCNENKKEIYKNNKTEIWLDNFDNYKNKKKYHEVFLDEYNKQKTNKEAAKLMLYKFGRLILINDIYDSLYYNLASDYIEKEKPIKNDSLSCYIMYHLGIHSQMTNDFNKNIYWTKKALKNLKDKNATIYIDLVNNIALSYIEQNKYDEALDELIKLLPIAEKKKEFSKLGSLCYNIASCYEIVNANIESEKYYRKSANNFLKAKDTSSYFDLQTTFAINHLNVSKDTIQTIKFLDSVFVVYDKFKNPFESDICNANFALAFKYFLLKDYNIALNYLKKSSEFYIKTNNLEFLKYNIVLEHQIEFYKNNKVSNIKVVDNLANELLDKKSYFESMQLYNVLYENYLKNDNYKMALLYKNKVDDIEHIVLEQNEKGQIYEYEKKYEAEKKEKIIVEKNELIEKNRLYVVILIITIFGLILVASLIFVRRKKAIIIKQNLQQEQFTNQLLQNTEEERNRIANELHDSVSHDLLNIKNNLINKKTIDVIDVEKTIENVRNISRNLHPAILQNLGFEASIEALCERVSEEVGLFTTCEIIFIKKPSKNQELQLYRIIQEALNNSIKHSKANAAKVVIISTKDNLLLEIKDNGNGFNVKNQLKNPQSFGLQSMLQRAKAISAKINVESSNKGTKIFLKILN